MARVTIVVTDTAEGAVEVNIDFDPPIDMNSGEQPTVAQLLATDFATTVSDASTPDALTSTPPFMTEKQAQDADFRRRYVASRTKRLRHAPALLALPLQVQSTVIAMAEALAGLGFDAAGALMWTVDGSPVRSAEELIRAAQSGLDELRKQFETGRHR